jgi:hypothetical protein
MPTTFKEAAEAVLREAEAQYVAAGGDPRVLVLLRMVHRERSILRPSRLVRDLIPIEPLPSGANVFYLPDPNVTKG